MDNYNEQIEALLNDDYVEFEQLLGIDSELTTHRDAWLMTGRCKKSLFAALPDMTICASQIELTRFAEHIMDMRDLVTKVLKDKPLSLPDVYYTNEDFKFTREQLEEFARRQRVARNC